MASRACAFVSVPSAFKSFERCDGSGVFVEARVVVFTAVCALVDVQNLSLRLPDAVVPDAIPAVKAELLRSRYVGQ